jgi:ketosteroid isomerase-like protein
VPDRETVEQLIRYTVEGRAEAALLAFYAEDVIIQENNQPPRIGRAASLARNADAAQWTQAVHEISVPRVLIDGNLVVIEWHAEWTLSNGERVRIEELALQSWEGDRVVFERFFYDPTPLLEAGFSIN